MPIIDAQVHIWGSGKPSGHHRQTSLYTAEELIQEMDAAAPDVNLRVNDQHDGFSHCLGAMLTPGPVPCNLVRHRANSVAPMALEIARARPRDPDQ